MNKTIFALVNNEPDVLMRITGLLRRKSIDIKNISMGETEKSSIAYLIVTIKIDRENIGQIIKCIKKLIDVYSVEEVDKESPEYSKVFSEKTAAIA